MVILSSMETCWRRFHQAGSLGEETEAQRREESPSGPMSAEKSSVPKPSTSTVQPSLWSMAFSVRTVNVFVDVFWGRSPMLSLHVLLGSATVAHTV